MRPIYYVTTPIYYVNARPHLGSLYSTLLADVAARWHKLLGQETFLLTGTDEHGQKIAASAAAAGKKPKEFVDSFVETFKDTWRAYNIEYNHFIRTTDQYHQKGVQYWLEQLLKKGDIYKDFYAGWYCTPCETFITEKDLNDQSGVTPTCPSCGRPAVNVSEECYFFRLSAYQEKLLEFYRQHPEFITPRERFNEIISFVKSGLKDLSLSRTTVTWGIPFPKDERHVTYVWADALNNYITAVGYADKNRSDEFKKWWPADVHVLGKDIVRFHAVYWPAFLMAIGLALPKRLLVHGWIKMGEQKMSKSLGNVVDPQELLRCYGADSVRYYLTRYLAVTQDSPFSLQELEQHISSDLADDLGNLLNRVITLSLKQDLNIVLAPSLWAERELALRDELWNMIAEVRQEMDDYYFHRAYARCILFVKLVNAYFHEQEPWRLAKIDPARFQAVISATLHSLHAIGILFWPVMPQKMEALLLAIGMPLKLHGDILAFLSSSSWHETFQLTQIPPLFIKPEAQTHQLNENLPVEDKVPQVPAIMIDDFAKVELVVGTIEKVDTIEKSEKLYRLQVNFGPRGIRQICSGVRQHFVPEDLLRKQGVFVFNLAPRKMLGFESQGMMLFVKNEADKFVIVSPQVSVPNGERLS